MFSPFGWCDERKLHRARWQSGHGGNLGKAWYLVMPKETMHDLLDQWKPKPKGHRNEPATEKEWEDLLLDYLRKSLPGMHIYPQGGRGMQRADIAIERGGLGGLKKDVIELKKGLKSSQVYNTLTGQIANYRRGREGWVFVIICGDDVDAKYLSLLKLLYKTDNELLGIFHKPCRKGVVAVV